VFHKAVKYHTFAPVNAVKMRNSFWFRSTISLTSAD